MDIGDLDIANRHQFRLKLINLVQKNPVLWVQMDQKNGSGDILATRKLRAKTWKKLANKLGSSSEKVRRTWEIMRSQYGRDLRRQQVLGFKTSWHLFHELNFLRPVIRPKKRKKKNLEQVSAEEMSCAENEMHENSSPEGSTTNVNLTNTDKFQDYLNFERNMPTPRKANKSKTTESNVHLIDEIIKIESDSDCDKEAETTSYLIPKASVETNFEEHTLPTLQLIPNSAVSLVANGSGAHTEKSSGYGSFSDNMSAEHSTVNIEHIAKRPRLIDAANDLEIQDDDYHFVISLLPSLRNVQRTNKFSLRVRIMNLINDELQSNP